MADEDLRARLREQPAPVHYDVARGLARHRALIEAGTHVPEWAQELPAQRATWLRRAVLWGGTLTVMTALWGRPTPEPVALPHHVTAPKVEVLQPSTPRSAPVREPVKLTPAAAPTDTPAEPVAAHPERAQELPTEPAALPARQRPRLRSVSPRPPMHEDESATHTTRGARVVTPEGNLELTQLVEAERALAGDPVRALRLAREGELSFRNGYFAQERRYIEVMALFALGRLGEAHAQAAAFLSDYPKAAYRRKVELETLRHPQH
jgi:hypothetical protein